MLPGVPRFKKKKENSAPLPLSFLLTCKQAFLIFFLPERRREREREQGCQAKLLQHLAAKHVFLCQHMGRLRLKRPPIFFLQNVETLTDHYPTGLLNLRA